MLRTIPGREASPLRGRRGWCLTPTCADPRPFFAAGVHTRVHPLTPSVNPVVRSSRSPIKFDHQGNATWALRLGTFLSSRAAVI